MFEAFAQKQRINRTRWVGASSAVHALLVIVMWRAIVSAPPPTPVEASKTEQRVTFFAPPPPPPPPGATQSSRPTEPKVVRRHEVVQPRPRQVLTNVVAPQPEPATRGPAGGVPGGVEGGVVGGVIGEFDSRMVPPKLISGPAIEYTAKALENDVEGLLIVRCVLTRSGEVRECSVKQSVRFMDNAVVETLERRRYTPVTLEGRPVEVYYTFRIRLNLPR